MPSTCEFQLNNPNGFYYTGETISGTIILKTTSAKDVRDIRIIFRGEGKVSWQETEKRRKTDGTYTHHTVQYRANDLYVENISIVRGEGVLPSGTHTYTFQIILPLQCPTSCEGRFGHIRYILTLKLTKPFRFDNEYSKPLSIINTQDLNLNPVLKLPLECDDIFRFCCCSCSGGTINTIFKVPFGGYAIGQVVKYSILVQNQTMDDITGYRIEFLRKMAFIASTPHHKIREDVTVLYKQSDNTHCLRLTTRLLEGSFQIVSTPPSTEGENIIHIGYSLKVTLIMGGCSSDHTTSMPLFIGTVALRESLSLREPRELVAPSAPELPSVEESGNDLPPSYYDLGPPSFEEALRCSTPFEDTDKDQHNRYIGFRPLYPSYSQSDD